MTRMRASGREQPIGRARPTGMTPRVRARWAGVLYVFEGVTSLLGHVVIPGMFVVPGDAAATAARVLSNELLYRSAITLGLAAVVLLTIQTVLLHAVFRRSGRSTILLFACVSLTAIAIQAVAGLLQASGLIVLGSAKDLGAFGPEQLQDLAFLILRMRAWTFEVFLVFFGIRCLLLGYMIHASALLPRVIGLLMALAGGGYLVYLWPPLAHHVAPFHLVLAAPGELSLVFWLLVYGVNGDPRAEAYSGSSPSTSRSSTSPPRSSAAR